MKQGALIRASRVAIAAAFIAAGSSCASKPVEITTGAIVSIDTTRQSVAKARKRPPAKTFWAAMTSLDPDYVANHPVSEDETHFAGALRTMMSGDADEAELLLDSLSRHAGDSIVRSASRILLTAALQYQNKWRELAEISPGAATDTSEADRAGVERWAAAFKSVPRREIDFPSGAIVLPLLLSAAGTPMVDVTINGKQKQFWLDTGSSMSIVSSDVAEESGVQPLVPDTLEVATTTGRVPARPAAIRRLDIGGLSIRSATSMIVASSLMEIRGGDPNQSADARIDGIVGFDIISQLNLQIDYMKGTVRISRPAAIPSSSAQRNFFWVGTPVVRVVSQNGMPLHFGLDTGAQETFAMDRLLGKGKVQTFLGERKRVGGFAGLKEFRGQFIPSMRLALRGKNILFQRVLVFTPAISSFVALDGVLGSDAGKTGVIMIDAKNGVFSIDSSPASRR
jgi:predicted aspartyl protease